MVAAAAVVAALAPPLLLHHTYQQAQMMTCLPSREKQLTVTHYGVATYILHHCVISLCACSHGLAIPSRCLCGTAGKLHADTLALNAELIFLSLFCRLARAVDCSSQVLLPMTSVTATTSQCYLAKCECYVTMLLSASVLW